MRKGHIDHFLADFSCFQLLLRCVHLFGQFGQPATIRLSHAKESEVSAHNGTELTEYDVNMTLTVARTAPGSYSGQPE